MYNKIFNVGIAMRAVGVWGGENLVRKSFMEEMEFKQWVQFHWQRGGRSKKASEVCGKGMA